MHSTHQTQGGCNNDSLLRGIVWYSHAQCIMVLQLLGMSRVATHYTPQCSHHSPFASQVGNRCRMARNCNRTCIVQEIGSFLDQNVDRNALFRNYTQLAWYHGAQVVLLWTVCGRKHRVLRVVQHPCVPHYPYQIWPRTITLPPNMPLDLTFTDASGGPAAQLAVTDMLAKVCGLGSRFGSTFIG